MVGVSINFLGTQNTCNVKIHTETSIARLLLGLGIMWKNCHRLRFQTLINKNAFQYNAYHRCSGCHQMSAFWGCLCPGEEGFLSRRGGVSAQGRRGLCPGEEGSLSRGGGVSVQGRESLSGGSPHSHSMNRMTYTSENVTFIAAGNEDEGWQWKKHERASGMSYYDVNNNWALSCRSELCVFMLYVLYFPL